MSPRFAMPVALVLLLALLPTAIHSYVGVRVTDHRTAAAIPSSLAGFHGTKTSRNATWGERRFDSTDWIERTYNVSGQHVQLVVVRSFDLKKVYHHPELAAIHGVDLRPAGIQHSASRPNVVHTLETPSGGRQVVMYALMYDDAFIEHPLWFQLQTAGKLLVGGRRQMTLFLVHQAGVPPAQAASETAAATILRAAVDAFVHQQPVTATNAD